MRSANDEQLENQIEGIDLADAKIDERTGEPDAGHHEIVKNIVAVNDPDAHVFCIVVRAVQFVQPLDVVIQAMPPVLRHIIENKQQADLSDDGPGRQYAFAVGKDKRGEQATTQQDQRLRHGKQHRCADRFDDAIFAALTLLVKKTGTNEFRDAEYDEDQQNSDDFWLQFSLPQRCKDEI